ncbi:hypothetical protein ESY86_13635 [Subsaximicrobium wynnwilliamsii]|jgi:vacuolar-type H+-ATPase subunit I/STV1|uniref:Uncharacterized protein n=1 Tax=Subsaximicrobium wynnwilliamsii TaxID=291179 RepID=A0A5C6ZEA7_9FLAO|nr:hypothetical protein [Subsaximicrobium wynnwilliamsii]TXD82495.1 hypothetical protein ESY87_13230 [Subsaximicrobium wynnwilliamsii]TXD88138.1 hypothetical protein ESY86_13635 [Subsaximicrobium wynnwilliamsii]TXE02153.1 hypothetical protein ESY88_12800 [Subsaximicrobium wynnwilliamsii]
METLSINILNPKAKKLLKDLADLKLIKINNVSKKSDFSKLLEKLRTKSEESLSIAEITKEVEAIRTSRYEK